MRQKALFILFALLLVSLGACQLPAVGGTGSSTPAPPGSIASANITPNDPSFHGCPQQGDGGDAALNGLKNRTDEGTYVTVQLSDLLALTWPSAIPKKPRSSWSSSDQATIAQHEGAPIEVEGYILDDKHEGTESTNCHSTDYRDFHVWFGASASAPRSQSMVIEITPRVRDQRPGWTDSAISALKGQHVRIRGWLLFDQEHPEQLNQTRATLWEIHPIMHIEVDKGGTWTSIDN